MRRLTLPWWTPLALVVACAAVAEIFGARHAPLDGVVLHAEFGKIGGDTFRFLGDLARMAGFNAGGFEWAFNWLRDRIFDVGRYLLRGLAEIGFLLKRIALEVKRLYTNIIKPLIAKIVSAVRRLSQLLHKWLDPIVRWLKRIRYEILKFYEKFVRPVLDAIDIIRRTLGLLGSLGVDWAKTLEQKLGALERRIQQPFDYLLGKINELIGWVNRIITIDGLLQRFTLFQSLWANRASLINFQINTITRPLTSQESAIYNSPWVNLTPEEQVIEWQQYARGESPIWEPAAREWGMDALRLVRERL